MDISMNVNQTETDKCIYKPPRALDKTSAIFFPLPTNNVCDTDC
jgi:hypothetical protein